MASFNAENLEDIALLGHFYGSFSMGSGQITGPQGDGRLVYKQITVFSLLRNKYLKKKMERSN